MRGLWLILGGLVSLPPYSSTSQAVCDYQTLIGDDENFCSRDLHVIYPDIGDVSCLYIPDCFDYPESLSKVWGHPRIKYAKSQPGLMYILIMVDPDAPNRYDPKYRFWRHWLVTDIPGQDLLIGNTLTGKVVSGYHRPNPPPFSGYHRYQFLLYLQPPGPSPSLTPNDEKFMGSWDVDNFVFRFNLGFPLAATQFMTMNPRQ